MKVQIELPEPPEGYEYTGEFRVPKKNEWTLLMESEELICTAIDFQREKRLILREKRWVPGSGEVFYMLAGDGAILREKGTFTATDTYYQIGNCFKTTKDVKLLLEEFKKAIEKVRTELGY